MAALEEHVLEVFKCSTGEREQLRRVRDFLANTSKHSSASFLQNVSHHGQPQTTPGMFQYRLPTEDYRLLRPLGTPRPTSPYP